MNLMNKSLFLVVLFFLFCKAPIAQTAIVVGSFEGAPEGAEVIVVSSNQVKYTTSIKNGKFNFTFTPNQHWDVYFVNCPAKSKDYFFPLFLRQNSFLDFRVDSLLKHVKISGDESAMEQNDYYAGQTLINEHFRELERQISATEDAALRASLQLKLKELESEIRKYNVKWIGAHRSSPFSVAVIRLFMGTPLANGEDTLAEQYFESLLPSAIKDNYQAFLLTQKFALFNNKYWQYDPAKKNGISEDKRFFLNRDAPDFVIKDTSGKKVRLKDFEGNYLLIDFWASWCGPCRANNPMLKSFYDRYHDKGLSVLSISVDTSASKWKEAIRKDEMNWIQGSDLSGLRKGVSLDYEISSIPVYFVIDPNGKVIIRSVDVRIDKVAAYLQSKLGQ